MRIGRKRRPEGAVTGLVNGSLIRQVIELLIVLRNCPPSKLVNGSPVALGNGLTSILVNGSLIELINGLVSRLVNHFLIMPSNG